MKYILFQIVALEFELRFHASIFDSALFQNDCLCEAPERHSIIKGKEKIKFNIFGETISMFAGFQRMWAMFAFISVHD